MVDMKNNQDVKTNSFSSEESNQKQWSLLKIDETSTACSHSPVSIDARLYEIARSEPRCSCVSRVLVLYTGGTIGMCPVNGAYQPVANFLSRRLARMPLFQDPSFTRLRHSVVIGQSINNSSSVYALPLTQSGRRILYAISEYTPIIDSSDMTMDDWNRIARDIGHYYDQFDGFVVLHGTDTLAFTSSALSFLLENLAKPVVITGSQLPIFELRSDGWNNLFGSLLVAGGEYSIPEVTVFFHDKLFRGSRIVKASSEDFDAFDSPNYPPLLEFGTEVKFNPGLVHRPVGKRDAFNASSMLCRDVAVLNIFPSISTSQVAAYLAPPTRGVVMRSYGSGNIPASRTDLLQLFKQAADRGILIVNVTQCYRGGVSATYANGVILMQYGVIPGYDITTEAALTKLAYVIGKHPHNLEARLAMLTRSLRGEVSIRPGASSSDNKKHQHESPASVDSCHALTTHLAKLMSRVAQGCDDDGRGSLWVSHLAAGVACAAASANNIAILRELYTVVGHLELSNDEHYTPLHQAAKHGALEAVQFILHHGGHVHVRDSTGRSALDYAVESNKPSPDLIRSLMDAGASFGANKLQITRAINACAGRGDIDRLRLYQLAGCSLQNFDNEGRAALHVAVANGQLGVVRYLLLEAGQKSNQVTGWGSTALEEARVRRFDKLVELIESHVG